jgi:rubredoxin-NAD+ reductase
LIGCEFANDLASAGLEVTLVDPAPWPLARLLPQPIGERLMSALQGIGCTLHLGRRVVRYAPAGQGFLAELDDGTQVAFEHSLSAVGLAPRTALAATAGLEVRSGIIVDHLLRTTDPAIYALGDCAETPAGLQPFIAPLLAQTRTLAATLSGEATPLHLPALPVVVKTPALPLVVCPPPPGASGTWELELELDGSAATALFRAPNGNEIGFVLAGAHTPLQRTLARRMPDLLP